MSKGLRYNKALAKDPSEGTLQPFYFNVLAQLANIPARITLYEFLRLSKMTRGMLRETLADAEVFVTQLQPSTSTKEPQSLHVSTPSSSVTFGSEDMQVVGKHVRPLYFTDYIGSIEIHCILVDRRSALSITPRRVIQN